MFNTYIYRISLVFLLGLPYPAFCQDSLDLNYNSFKTSVKSSDSVIQLPDKFLIKNSIHILTGSRYLSLDGVTPDYRYGILHLSSAFFKSNFPDSLKGTFNISVYYKNLPFNLQDSYSRFEILNSIDTLTKDTVSVAEVKTDFVEDIFAGTELDKSGSIFRGFTVGNNRDLTLNSGFRLQMNGRLSKDIEITAALTDENTPIQPEGNTQKLQELDKVFIEVRSKNVTTTLGDIDINFVNKEFLNFNRKVQGAKAFGSFSFSDLFFAAALSRGRFNTNIIQGIDGVQGPYRLTGVSNEINIVVIAGSEKVFIDGIPQTRGEAFDYTIDYSNGQITFTNRRLITSASRLTIDFEYSDKKFSRSLIAGRTGTALLNDKMKLSFSYIREKDDKDKPIDFTLSDSDKVILANAGDDRLKASKSGVIFVGRDTSGIPLGQYIKIDTTINNSPYTFYRYQPGDTNALYRVSFAFVGQGKGDYTSLSTTVFKFAGIKGGSYLPIIFFPLPISYQGGDLNLDFSISKNAALNIETSVSSFDKNLFSQLDKKDNTGLALHALFSLSDENFKIDRLNLGKVSFTLSDRFINKLYYSIDRLNGVEYNRLWDIQDSSKLAENTAVAKLEVIGKKYLLFSAEGGNIKRGSSFNSTRGSVILSFTGDSLHLPSINYFADYVSGKDNSIDYKSSWFRQAGELNYILNLRKNLSYFDLDFKLNSEDKRSRSVLTDTLQQGSFRFYELIPRVSLNNFFGFDLGYRFLFRRDDNLNAGLLTRLSNSYTQNFSIKTREFSFMNAGFEMVIFNKKFSPEFLSLGLSDVKTVLVNSQANVFLLNSGLQGSLFYKISSQRTAKSEVVFIKVQIGQGNYVYRGDKNGNGIQDEDEFELVNFDGDYIRLIIPTDQLFPTTDLQASSSFILDPSKFIKVKNPLISTILKNISVNTYFAVAEKSKDPVQRNLYFLKFSTFQNEQNTLAGTNTIQQDINIFENYRYFGLRLRFIQRRGFNQYFSGNERFLNIERSVKLRLSFTPDITMITEYTGTANNNNAPALIIRNRQIKANTLTGDLSYKPYSNFELGFKAEQTRAIDYYPFNHTQADINSQIIRFNYSIKSDGRLRIEIQRNEAILNTNPLFVPYELTSGRVIGKSFIWNLSFDYKLSTFIQATLNYTGRAEGKSKVIHTGTAEVRAFF